MQNQNTEVKFPQRDVAKLIGVTDLKFPKSSLKRKCSLKSCNKIGCRKFWHEPLGTVDPGFFAQLWPTVFAVGLTEIFFGVSLIVVLAAFRDKYDKLYLEEAGEILRVTSSIGLVVLALCGVMLTVSLITDNRKIMLIRILTSTGWSGYVVVLSMLKIHMALLASEADPHIQGNLYHLMNNAGMIELFTLLGVALHFFGDIAVFTYYNIRYLQPELFSGLVEHV